jgi:hypothetical protein
MRRRSRCDAPKTRLQPYPRRLHPSSAASLTLPYHLRPQKTAAKKAAGGDKKAKAKASGGGDEGTLADPLAEKLRQQRLQEAADLEHARAAFGDAGKNLDELLPRTEAVRGHKARNAEPPAAMRSRLSPSHVGLAARRISRSLGS